MKPKPKLHSVMLIDDSEIDNYINTRMVEACNVAEHIYTHTSGKSALEFLRNILNAGKDAKSLIPQIIFLDINMPLMDGFQFIMEYDKFPSDFRSLIKLIMLTTSINPIDISTANKYQSISEYVNKPLTESYLKSL